MIWNISGYDVLIDEEDYERLKAFKYNVNRHKVRKYGRYYFSRDICDEGIRYAVALHRDIMNCIKGDKKVVDHTDGNTLDCRKSNLRLSTNTENCRNAKIRKDNTSGVKGVTWYARHKKWVARIQVNNLNISLGYHDNIEDAKAAYAEASRKYHGEFGRTK